MTNLEKTKQQIYEIIGRFTEDEMYEFLLGDIQLCTGLCKYCIPIHGECEEDCDGDDICRERFRDWCSREVVE